MSAHDHWMRFNIGDYLADTMDLTALQHGIYLLLIMHYFKRGPLPDDEAALARIAKVNRLIWRRDAPAVMALFRREKGLWLHTRIEAEIAFSQALSAKRSESGKSGAYRRWGMANANDANGKSHAFAIAARVRARAAHHSPSDSSLQEGMESDGATSAQEDAGRSNGAGASERQPDPHETRRRVSEDYRP